VYVPHLSVALAWTALCFRTSPADSGGVFKFRSCANYFNHGYSTRELARAEEERLMAALDTVSAIPRGDAADSDEANGKNLVGKRITVYWYDDKYDGWYDGMIVRASGSKHTVSYDDGSWAEHVLKDTMVGRSVEHVYPIFSVGAFLRMSGECRPITVIVKNNRA